MCAPISGDVMSWGAGQLIFDCTRQQGNDPGPIRISAQEDSYRIEVLWGGHDKSNGTPNGSIKLFAGLDDPIDTTMKYRPDPGDDDKTWRWDGKAQIDVPAGQPRTFRVWHDTSNGSAQNTYLRIRFLASA